MHLQSPAKLNLFLKVDGKRPDGYHNLCSLFQTIDLCDEITITKSDQDCFSCSLPSLPTDERNLVIKARDLFRKKTNCSFPVSIHLEKKIPAEAGLGGGSSNAATTLWALNELAGLPATVSNLIVWGSEFGSDISFFLSQGTAYCTGRGEIINPLQPLPPQTCWLIIPPFSLSTPSVFKALSIGDLPARDEQAALQECLSGRPQFFNDLEIPAFALKPELKALKDELQAILKVDVAMTGSGTCLFCISEKEPPVLSGCKVVRTQFINRPEASWY